MNVIYSFLIELVLIFVREACSIRITHPRLLALCAVDVETVDLENEDDNVL